MGNLAAMLVEIELDQGRGPVVVKRPVGPEDRRRLACESRALAAAQHPGVVRVVEQDPAGHGSGPLILRWAGAHTLETIGRLSPAKVASVMAEVAATVADLHSRGIAHNRITPDHVLLNPNGQPILCGLRTAGPASESARSTDVKALARLVEMMLGSTNDLEPIPDHRLFRPRRWDGYQRRALLMSADQACSDSLTHRSSARKLSEELHNHSMAFSRPSRLQLPRCDRVAQLAALSKLCRSLLQRPSRSASRQAQVRSLVLKIAPFSFLLVLVIAVGASRRTFPSEKTPAGAEIVSTSAPPSPQVASAPVTTIQIEVEETGEESPSPATAKDPTCVAISDPAAALGHDGCVDGLALSGGQVEVGGVGYRLGQPDDQIVVANWGCQHTATPALLRPGTGEVFIFDRWATSGQKVTVAPVEVVPDAIGLTEASDRNGCPVVEVTTAHSKPVLVSWPSK